MFNAFVTFFAGMDALTIVAFVLTNACFISWIFVRKWRFLPFVGIFGMMLVVLFRLKAGYSHGNEPIWFTLWTIILVVGIYMTCNFTVKTIYMYNKTKKSRVGYMHDTEIKLNKKGTPDFEEMLGKTGVVKSDLKPTGKVDFGDRVLDCVANKGYIYAGNTVKVVKIEGHKIVVAKRK